MTTMSPKFAPLPPRPGMPFRFTREQYFELDRLGYFGDVEVERLRGEIVVMSAVNWSHVVGCRKTETVLETAFKGVAWINVGNPIPTEDSDPQPDVMVVPGQFEDYTDHPTTALLIVEVSGATLDKDTTIKAEIYATAGIADYWVLDLENRRSLIFRDPQPIPDGGSAYRTLVELSESDTATPLAAPVAQLRVADLLP